LSTGGDVRGSIEQFVDRTVDPNVVGFLHRPAPAVAAKDALVLTHGAGANCRTQLLVALAEAFAEAGLLVLRCDLPYRQSSPHGPPKPGGAERDREGLRNAVLAMRALAHGRTFLGGHSYGGRQASMLVASAPELVDGLMLLSYPLHPPRTPQQLRTQHFPQLRTPALFVQGTRDPFGSEEELTEAVRVIPARTSVLFLAGAGHDLKLGKSAGATLPAQLLERFAGFFGGA
jgi:predicted alpha/beta-hydrolase family hydrolase